MCFHPASELCRNEESPSFCCLHQKSVIVSAEMLGLRNQPSVMSERVVTPLAGLPLRLWKVKHDASDCKQRAKHTDSLRGFHCMINVTTLQHRGPR